MQRLVNNLAVRHSLQNVDPITEQQETEWVESLGEENGWHFLVCDGGTRVGIIGRNEYDDVWGVAEAGFMIAPEQWDSGYATDALTQLCEYGFGERRLNKVVAKAYETNQASQRVLKKVGFAEEGRLRDEASVEGEYLDIHRYGVLASEWLDAE